MSVKHISCDICGGNDFRTVAICDIAPIDAKMEEKTLALVQCKGCSLVFVNPQPVFSKEKFADLYSREYFDKGYMKFYDVKKDGAVQSNEDFSYRLSLIEKFKSKGRILDIGCATGEFLSIARDRGWEVSGVDASDYAAEAARSKYGLKIFKGTVEEADLPRGYFDVVAAGDILEHMPGPKDFLLKVRSILKDDGMLYIATPNFDSFHYRLMRFISKFNHRNYFLLPHHLFQFTETTLLRLLEISGFSVERVVRSQSRYGEKGFKGSIVRFTYSLGRLAGMPDRILVIAKKAK